MRWALIKPLIKLLSLFSNLVLPHSGAQETGICTFFFFLKKYLRSIEKGSDPQWGGRGSCGFFFTRVFEMKYIV